MHGLALIYVLRDLPGIQGFRIEQESLGLTRVQVVPGAEFGDAQRAEIVEAFRRRLGAEVNIVVEPVAAIEPERSGKYRYVVSRVAPAPAAASEACHA